MQRAINLCLGAFVSTVGLTVPAVLAIGLLNGKQLIMGISSIDMALFVATVVLSLLTFNGQVGALSMSVAFRDACRGVGMR